MGSGEGRLREGRDGVGRGDTHREGEGDGTGRRKNERGERRGVERGDWERMVREMG